MPSLRRQPRKLLTAAAAVVAVGVAATTAPAQASPSTSEPHAQPHADGIIAVLIGAYAPPPLGSTKGGSFHDASTVYGSAD